MKTFLKAALAAVLCISLSFSAFATSTPTVDAIDDEGGGGAVTETPGMGNSQSTGPNSWMTNVTVSNGITSGDEMRDSASGDFSPGNIMSNNTIPNDGNMFSYDPTNDSLSAADWIANIESQASGGGSAQFWSDLETATGMSKDAYAAQMAAGECPVINVAPSPMLTVNGAPERTYSTEQYLMEATGLSQDGLDAITEPGMTVDQVMQAAYNLDNSIADNFGSMPGTGGSMNFTSGLYGFYFDPAEGGFYPSSALDGAFELGEEISDRGGNAYINLCEMLDVIPEPELEPEPPPPPPESIPMQEWKSKPLAFGEVKHNSYSISRTSEEWEAMAGIPHDEKLFLDEGGSTHSAHYKTKDATDYPLADYPSHSSGFSHPGPKCPRNVYDCPSGCGVHHSHAACDGTAHPCPGGSEGDEDSEPEPCEHGNVGSCGLPRPVQHCVPCGAPCVELPPQHSVSFNWKMEEEVTNYYPMEGIDVRWMDTFNEELGWADPSSFSIEADKLGATVTWSPTVGWQDGRSFPSAGPTCSHAHCLEFLDAVNSKLDSWASAPFGKFQTQKLTIRDRDGVSYKVLWDNDLQWGWITYSPVTECGQTIEIDIQIKGTVEGEKGASDGGTINYPADTALNPSLPKHQTNFLPYEEDWSTTQKIEICGYNGQYSNPRRHYHGNPGDEHFFMETDITISDIVNGEKTSGDGTLDFGPQGGGRHSNFFWGSGVDAEDSAPTEYYAGAGHVNNIVVHSPVALSEFYHSVPHLPFDQRYSPGPQGDVYLTPSLDFYIHSSIDWAPNGIETYAKGIASTTAQKGNGYYTGRDTSRWIDSKYYTFPFEVLYKGTRYGANDWIEIPVQENRSKFTLPVSEKEVVLVEYRGVVIAKNEPEKDPDHVYNDDSEYMQNYERDSSPHGSSGKEAMHGANNHNEVSILGRIGNFAVEYTDDPNWGPFFSKTTSGWNIPNVLQNVDIQQPNKFLGPHRDIFDRTHWTVNGDVYTSRYPWGLDHYGGVPTLGKDLMGAILPAGEGKNNESHNGLLQYKPIKLGYTAWWSIQTIGNYGTAATKLQAQPQFYLFDPMSPTEKQYVDVWTKVGDTYRRIYDHTGKANASAYTLDYFTKLNQPERRIGDVEKDRTESVTGPSLNLFDERANIKFGSPNGITLTQTLRTFIGGTMWEDVNHQPNAVARTEADHAEQVQRWHGTIYLPSSSKFTKPGDKTFVNTQVFTTTESDSFDTKLTEKIPNGTKDVRNLLIGVEFVFKTEGAAPWNIWTQDSLIVGSNLDNYKPWIRVVPPEDPSNPHDPNNPPYIHVEMPPPPNVPIVFDPNENSLEDISLHGTH